MKLKQLFIVLFIVLFATAMVGCAHVPVWERGHLAKHQMAIDPYPLQNHIQLHNYSSREAAASTHSADGGGGCGCY
ncbi:DUF4266 domain-containing protein [Nitrosomonas sp.]|uniref:DUF4266 domain-containing protein n=1 Tax=Nitrosomonas sp. TaxID=42353 RepID=UPI001D27A9B2|nr:DUF4266 domain-containing protein [Nitrosomonas sp.]MCB1948624.1 DUF4266 domain-containing protein [Nitrosomonas sp.]MCP5243203.1 DUF4266 domain-containing protein [Burkholderiales bacterium]MDR4513980.1 DUF4266 domain-containing protein [Nitrosomonas sp.]